MVDYDATMNKRCVGCHRVLVLSEFTKNAAALDGLSSRCKACQRLYRVSAGLQKPADWVRKTEDKAAYHRQWRQENKDKVQEYERKKKYNPEKEARKYERKMKRLKGDSYVVGNPANRLVGMPSELVKARRRAREYARRAIARGRLVRLPCEVCGHEVSEAHHPDYSQPLSVVWLCQPHHKEVHAMV